MSDGITRKEMIEMNSTASAIKGVLDNLRMQLQMLDDEIKADEKSKAEFERHLNVLENRKSDILSRINANKEWSKNYDADIGPFANKYKEMTADIAAIYDRAKAGHTRGIKLLEKDFGYHPSFKRPQDTFTAIPFRPK
eukprot:CAMPEP_0185031050 /NCGR_PEP_ID=MMETSP1103-20130426/18289_1 /TAXON_ID=36769 /ORGANISM="Paraphysomonas bandaiensis, Strain Caron Lab Isolate" /LENGTH=137 /DNA_ID=CAMNT_0027566411 /DNA_START=132 /DNA_END=545 /DNA_ORIENTATION=-